MYRARRLPVHAGPAAWSVIIGEPPPPRILEGHISSDVTIIGAGFAGLSAARRLLQLDPGLHVTLLEAGRVAEGAGGRNSGFMVDLPHELTSDDYAGESTGGDRLLTDLNRRAIAFAAEAVEEYGINPAYFDRAGKVNGAAAQASHHHNLAYAAHLDMLGEPYEMLDAQAMTAMTGSRHYRSGLYTPGTVVLQPAGYVRGLAAGLSGTAHLYEATPALRFVPQEGAWRVETPRGTVSTGTIILANNGHLESFGIRRQRLMHIFLFACMTGDLPPETLERLGGQSRWGITPSDPMGTTVRRIDGPLGGNRIVTRTCAVFRPGMTVTTAQVNRARRIMRRKFDDRFPQLKGAPMEHVWSGHLCLSRNGVSVTAEVDKGVFAACCQNGLGTTRGTLTGIAAAEAVCGASSPVRAYFEGQPAPTRLPPPPLSTIGAAVTLRWREWKARRE